MKTIQYKAKIFYTQSVIANAFKHQYSIVYSIECKKKNLCLYLYNKHICIFTTIRKFNYYSIFYLILTKIKVKLKCCNRVHL